MNKVRRKLIVGLLSWVSLKLPAVAQQNLPNRLVLVVPFGPGSGVDFIGRMTAEKLSERLQEPVVVENRTGAGGISGEDYVAKADPDGGTLLLMESSAVLQKWLHKTVPFDVITDFAPIARVATSTLLLCAQASFPPNNIHELVALVKAEPGKLSAGTPGVGSPHHLALMLFNSLANIDIVNVPYRSSAASVNDLLAGQIPMVWTGLTAIQSYLKAGTVKLLGSASEHRLPLLPDVPTFAEEGVPGVIVNNWFGVSGPAKTPPDVIARLSKELTLVAADPDFQKRLQDLGFESAPLDADQFRTEVQRDHEDFGKLIRDAGIVPQ
jgi:tripartite-type tricarboxylate transporter receptor subunit TctC